ncbi:MAG: aminotransferase class V-fold PLP-dependent enzyme [Gemmatimonadota bacterium]
MAASPMDRREFARLFALGGTAALLSHPGVQELRAATPRLAHGAPGPGAARPDWAAIRAQFLMPEELSVMNAANLCPSPRYVMEEVTSGTERLDREPLPSVRDSSFSSKEWVRERVAAWLRARPEEILLTRNTSESNNWVVGGVELAAGDEVLILNDNHPSTNAAWKRRGERHGFTVREVAQVNPHPGAEYYLEAFRRAMTPRTRIVAFSHLTNTAGDLMPAEALCAMAREEGILSAVDGAQSLGLLDVDLSRMRPDFYSGSAHKWPCGPKEVGLLYVNRAIHGQFWPSVVSAYPGQVGISRTHEGMGQRDEAAIQAFGRQADFLMGVGQSEIEARSRALADAAMEGLQRLDGVTPWTSLDPTRRVAVVTFQPGNLEPGRVLAALESDGIVAAARGGSDRPGIRFSPHYYNSFHDVERGVEAIGRYLQQGI